MGLKALHKSKGIEHVRKPSLTLFLILSVKFSNEVALYFYDNKGTEKVKSRYERRRESDL